jgi:acyl-CoA synthetase (NDP forming)
VVATWQRTTKPFLLVLDTGSFGGEVREILLQAGMPFVTRIDDGLRVLDVMQRRRAMTNLAESLTARPSRPTGAGPLPHNIPAGALTEAEAKDLAAAYGIPVTNMLPAENEQQAIDAAEKIGYPVVLKGVSRTVVHKSDLGLVKIALTNASAVRTAFAQIRAALAIASPPESLQVLVQQHVVGVAEVIVGARFDEYGPQVMVGLGGVLVEVLQDVCFACAPVSVVQAQAMCAELKLYPVLKGVRGRPPADLDAIADAVVRVSWLAADLGARLQDFELNPLIVRAAGAGLVAVDGRGSLVKDTVKDTP